MYFTKQGYFMCNSEGWYWQSTWQNIESCRTETEHMLVRAYDVCTIEIGGHPKAGGTIP